MTERLLGRVETRAPFVVGALFAVPVFFMSLLISSLAVDRPSLRAAKLEPTGSGTEAKVWLAALIGPAIMLAVGALALLAGRYGVFLSIAVAIAACLWLPGLAGGYIGRHERRFPSGMDFVPDNTAGNASSRGDWEHSSKETVLSISHWTLVLAILALVVALVVLLRRPHQLEAGGDLLVDPVTGAAKTVPALELADADSDPNRGGLSRRLRNRR